MTRISIDRPTAHKLVGDQHDPADRYYQMTWNDARRAIIAEAPAGKPSIAVLSNGDIVVSYIRNYQIIDTPKGETMEVVRSSDGGRTWSEPVRATVSPHNDREGYLIRFADDTLLICYMRVNTDEPARPWQGPYLVESRDGGRTWSDHWQVDISDFCPQGPYGAGDRGHVVLPDGTLLLFVSTYYDPPCPYEYVLVSHDRGRTFEARHLVSDKSGDGSFCLAADGSVAGVLRINADNWPHRDAHPELRNQSECVHFLAYSRSDDRGQTWSQPQQLTGFNEIPGHIASLRDGRLLMSFGVRHYPLGIQAVLTDAAGNWDLDRRLMLAWSGGQLPLSHGYARHTIGHPFTAQLPDGTLMTAYYRLSDPFNGHSCRVEALFWTPPPIA